MVKCKEGQKVKFYIMNKIPGFPEERKELTGTIKKTIKNNFETYYQVITEQGIGYMIWNYQIISKEV